MITPMAASEPMGRRRVTDETASAEASPHTPAPRKTLTPARADTANPPKMAWLSPWPM